MRNNENGRHWTGNIEEAPNHGTARRTNLGSVPCGMRYDGGDRTSRRVDVFEVRDDQTERTYTYFCADGVEFRFTERQIDVLATILD